MLITYAVFLNCFLYVLVLVTCCRLCWRDLCVF